ncbi:SEC10/PgrA surface exclusion domain-containing protein [Ligilactobacillus salivarius]|uniref:SEC10/PgrA surface exclusion domain-containing protein n=1 Tax=Ligilactobacillus salivarius TaxID=1624 RepID=UPI001873FCA6|nr:SEC10/PgrA surface exclusion domain-containing protein [Ligilactobacillus salivarius]MBE5066814.1 SEC10/PgrA surface exclusion domain-containing protein [Ligilactobacillus salivarius]
MKNNNIKKTLSIAAAVAATASFATANNVHADTVTNNQSATSVKDDSGIKPNQESTQAASSSVTQAQVDEAQKNVNDTQSQINQNQQEQSNVKQQISDADSQISNIQNDYNAKNSQINDNEAKIVDNYQQQINNIQNNQVNDEKQDLNNQILDLNGQVETLQNQKNSSSQSDDDSKYTNVDGEIVTPSADTQKVLDKIDTNADYISNLYRNGLIGNTTGNSHARINGGYIISDTYGVDKDADSGDNYSLKAGGDDLLTFDSSITSIDEMNQNYVINNKLNDVDPIKNGQLTTDQERELAIIVANKLNNTREKLGLSRWVMTEKDFELAQKRASQQSAINLQHNLDDINSVFGGVYGENLALALFTKDDNFNGIMQNIDGSIAQLIDSDKGSDYGHRYNILNQDGHIALGIKQVSKDTIMITMDWMYVDDDNGPDLLALPAQLKAQGPTKKATVVVDNSAKIAQLKSQIADLQTKLANVQFNYDNLSSSDKKTYDNLKNEIEVTHTKANNARNTLKQNSQASIDQVAQTKAGLYNTLYDLQDQMKTLQDKLVLQKTKLVQLQDELNNSKSDNNKTDNGKSESNKTDDNKTTDDSKSEGNKTDNGKSDDNKSEDNKSDGKTDNSKSDSNKTDDNKSDNNKSDDSKTDDSKSDNKTDGKDNVTPVKPSDNKTDGKDNVAPAKPSDSKSNNDSVVDTAKQAINQSKGQVNFSDKENVIALPDGSKLVNLYSSNGLIRYSATVLSDGTVRNIHEQLVRKTNDGKTIEVAQGQDGSQTVYNANKDNNEPAKTTDKDKVVVNDVKKVATTPEKKVEVKAIAKKAEAPKADAKTATLPQMGEKDNNEAAVVGLGLAGVAGALGLGVLNKKRS